MNKVDKDHPTAELLAAFGSGRLGATEREAIERHIAECDRCCAALTDVPADSLLALARF